MSEGASESVRIRIGTVAVTAASAVEARRLADALPAALERAWRAADTAPPMHRPRRGRPTADTVADEVVRAARRALDGRGGNTGDTGEGAP
jgi:hypothetical protein